MPPWMQWIGLPHRFGANPEDGEAADCIVMVFSVLRWAGVHHPPFEQRWLDLAAQGRYPELVEIWQSKTRLLPNPKTYSITMLNHGDKGLGFGVVVDDGVLTVNHKRGVYWIPVEVTKNLSFYEFV